METLSGDMSSSVQEALSQDTVWLWQAEAVAGTSAVSMTAMSAIAPKSFKRMFHVPLPTHIALIIIAQRATYFIGYEGIY
jgi:hypothetical protein